MKYGIVYTPDAADSYVQALEKMIGYTLELRVEGKEPVDVKLRALHNINEAPWTLAICELLNEHDEPSGKIVRANIWETEFHVY